MRALETSAPERVGSDPVAHASRQALHLIRERLVCGQIRPHRAAIGELISWRTDTPCNFLRQRPLEFREPLMNLEQVRAMRIASAPGDPLHTRAVVGDLCEVVRP